MAKKKNQTPESALASAVGSAIRSYFDRRVSGNVAKLKEDFEKVSGKAYDKLTQTEIKALDGIAKMAHTAIEEIKKNSPVDFGAEAAKAVQEELKKHGVKPTGMKKKKSKSRSQRTAEEIEADRKLILQKLGTSAKSVGELAERTKLSKSTVRRDLAALVKEKKVKKNKGTRGVADSATYQKK
jgi:DNA-binding transcriptional ArsR family regulator